MSLRSYLSRNRRKLTVSGIAGAAVGVVGVGLAAVVLSSAITGHATITTAPGDGGGSGGDGGGASSVALSVAGAKSADGSLDCTHVGVSPDYKTITFNPALTRPADGSTPAESCDVTLTVRNTGANDVHVDPSSRFTAPGGWGIALAGDSPAVAGPIAPGAVAKAKVTLTAGADAVEGDFGGQLVYADAK